MKQKFAEIWGFLRFKKFSTFQEVFYILRSFLHLKTLHVFEQVFLHSFVAKIKSLNVLKLFFKSVDFHGDLVHHQLLLSI